MFSERLKALRAKAGISQAEIARKIYISQPAYAKYELGTSTPNPETLASIASILDCSVDYLLGKAPKASNAGYIRIPVLGSVPAGIPLEAIEDIIDYEEIPQSLLSGGKEYFALEVKGDSMWPDYLPGDVVIVRKQPVCNSGDDCIVYVNGYDATLKQVRLNEDDHSLTIVPRNQSYPPRTYTQEEIQALPVTIAGVIVELRRKIKK